MTPVSPRKNGKIESLNACIRGDLLNGEIFYSLAENRIIIENWQQQYNKELLHTYHTDIRHQHTKRWCQAGSVCRLCSRELPRLHG